MADKFQLKAIISAVDKITPVLKGVQRSARMTNKSLRDIGGAGSKLMGSLGLPAGIAFGAVIYGASRAAAAALQYAGSIQDAADRTGAGVVGYQTLANILESVGGSAEDAEMAFSQFNKGISAAASGADQNFAGLMNKLKIPMRDAQGNVRSLTDMMPELADAFAKNENPALRTRMAMELFGKAGTKMIPILKGGKKAYMEYAAEQQRMGTILRKDSIGALDDMGDSIGLLGKQLKVQLIEGIAKLMPVLQPIIKSMSEWIANNKELIQTTITKTLTEIVDALKQVDWMAFVRGIRDTIKSIGNFIEMIGGLKTVLIALGVIFLAGPVAAIFSMIGAIWGLGAGLLSLIGGFSGLGAAILTIGKIFAVVGRMFLLNPIGLAVTAIAAAAYLIYKNWEPIKEFFSGLWEGVKASFSAGWEFIKTIFGYSPLGLIMSNWEPIKEFFSGLWEGVKASFSAGWEFIKTIFGYSPLGLIMKAWGPVMKFFSGLWDTVGNILGSSADANVSVTQDAVDSAKQSPLVVNKANQTSPLVKAMSSGGQQTGRGAPGNENVQLNGEMVVRFENAPAGMRVNQGSTNHAGVWMNPDVGYRSLGYGL